MRCHICGSTPSQEHNVKTHEAHFRMWKKLASNPYDGHAQRVFAILAGRELSRVEECPNGARTCPS